MYMKADSFSICHRRQELILMTDRLLSSYTFSLKLILAICNGTYIKVISLYVHLPVKAVIKLGEIKLFSSI